MPTVHAVYKPIKIICYCLQAGQAQLLLYLNNISIYIILSNIRIELSVFCCICNRITPKAKGKLQKYSKTIEYCNV